ncbi:MAG: dihydrolipoyl dehydrogenase family protein, partial [bacterium]
DYTGLPTTLFTIPPMASVGLQEEEAVARGLRFRVEEADTADWYHARRIREDTSAHRILLEEGSDRILGAHLLGPGSDELVNLFALAIQTDLRAPDLKSALFAYPTTASNLPSML